VARNKPLETNYLLSSKSAILRIKMHCVKNRFFEITSREGKMAYIPLSQLVRIEAVPRGGIFLNFSENFQVNMEISNGLEAGVAKSLYDELSSDSTDPIRLSSETLNVTDIHF
jgi:hypothetical protein